MSLAPSVPSTWNLDLIPASHVPPDPAAPQAATEFYGLLEKLVEALPDVALPSAALLAQQLLDEEIAGLQAQQVRLVWVACLSPVRAMLLIRRALIGMLLIRRARN